MIKISIFEILIELLASPFSGVIISNGTYKYYIRKGGGSTPMDQAPPIDNNTKSIFPGYKISTKIRYIKPLSEIQARCARLT